VPRHRRRPPRAADLLLDGLAALLIEGHIAATPVVREALSAFDTDETAAEDRLRWLWLAGRTAGFTWDYERGDSLTARQVRAAREVGALGHLPLALSTRVGVNLFAGELQAAASLVEQSDVLADATHDRIVPLYGALVLAAFRGCEDGVTRLIRTGTPDLISRGQGLGLTVSQWATALLYNGLARYEDAFTAAADATTDPHELWFSTFPLVELIEGANRSGRAARAANALEALRESTRAANTPWGLGVEARSSALLTTGEAAETPISSPTSGCRRSPRERRSSSRPPASAPGNGPSTRVTNSLRRRRRSRASSPGATRTERSPRSCSSARARSSTTSARCSGSST
jgi:hypothetical protein